MNIIEFINGPNLNLIEHREVNHYGGINFQEIQNYTEQKLKKFGFAAQLNWFQSNVEGEIVNQIQKIHLKNKYSFLVINPGGYSHTSVAILDALKLMTKPIVEVHLSHVHRRESFRQTLITAQAAEAVFSGLGRDAYWLGAISQLSKLGSK